LFWYFELEKHSNATYHLEVINATSCNTNREKPMRVVHGAIQIKSISKRPVVSIGNFDGVHLGHRSLLTRVKTRASELEAESIILTFTPHPLQVLRPDLPFAKLFDFADQVEQMGILGMDVLILEPFSREFSELSAEEFFLQWLVKHLNPQHVVVGYDFSFGAQKKGNIQQLAQMCKKQGIGFEVVDAEKKNGEIVSSTVIRKSIESGDVTKAAEFLGRKFYLKGLVVKGDGRGRGIGFPTANIFIGEQQTLPARGVYLTETMVRDKSYMSLTNIGLNPTFLNQGTRLRVETFISDFHEDIYGETIQVNFVKKIREEKKFDSVKELVNQISLDLELLKKTIR
jgi:riboflavin kinase/FMN adenylyltransferase